MEKDKENHLIIGKSRNPRCFKGSHIEKLPVIWVSNKKAWMTTNSMNDWLLIFNAKMKRQKQKVLLFPDNVNSHSNIPFDNVKIVFL